MLNIYKGLAATMMLAVYTANAGIITFSDTFGTAGDHNDVTLSGAFSTPLVISQFDTLGGTRTLTNVEIAVESQIISIGSSQNASTTSELGYASFGLSYNAPWQITSGGAADTFIFEAASFSEHYFKESDPSKANTLAVGESLDFDYDTSLRSGSLSGISFAAFVAGDVTLAFSASVAPIFINTTAGGSSVFINTLDSGIYGKYDVTYTWMTTPSISVNEPGSLALLGASILCLGMLRRKTIRTAK